MNIEEMKQLGCTVSQRQRNMHIMTVKTYKDRLMYSIF